MKSAHTLDVKAVAAANKMGGVAAPERLVTTNRAVLLSVGVVNLLFGAAMALFINHYIGDFSLIAPEWYDSYWLPLGLACLCYVIEAVCVQLPVDWLYGLLITAPPYGWHACLATVLYLKNRSEVSASEFLKIGLPALLLALSGGILNPIIARLVAHLRSRWKMSA